MPRSVLLLPTVEDLSFTVDWELVLEQLAMAYTRRSPNDKLDFNGGDCCILLGLFFRGLIVAETILVSIHGHSGNSFDLGSHTC